MFAIQHQYIERDSGRVCTERLFADRAVKFLYSNARENAPALFNALTSAWGSGLLGYFHYKTILSTKVSGKQDILQSIGINRDECVDNLNSLDTFEKVFERKIRYWKCRPMTENPCAIVSPADSRAIIGSFCETSSLFLKGKFFDYEELFGCNKREWLSAFQKGTFAVFRLTPEKYHYNHAPVAGKVVDFYEIDGDYHACNPGAVVTMVTPYSKNKRVVTVIDTDVPGGSRAGIVAMLEIVALMIGKITQCYSEIKYEFPQPVSTGMFLKKGLPKSLYLPGSSTTVLIFQKGRVRFAEDLIRNMFRQGVESRFSKGFGMPLVETDIRVRSCIGNAISNL
ncbi:MAG TPA: phosphatidylserine decarboxylase [Candidatus Wunengus sp. YC60]|uniref:phosphatidylserine decarboxylase n=1 Tax=Candidatus Wunengus sp. YC60 TaxID=3367697 RepID=UPI004029385D